MFIPQETELESIQLQTRVEQLKEEKERLLNGLVEAEYVPIPYNTVWSAVSIASMVDLCK